MIQNTQIVRSQVGIISALLFACSIGAGGVRAQSNSEYKFRQQAAVNGASYGGAPAVTLPMPGLTANGYGQWTTTSYWDSSYTMDLGEMYEGAITYYLLGNGLYKPSTSWDSAAPASHPGCIPEGIVDSIQWTFNTSYRSAIEFLATPEDDANLDGSEFFVSVLTDSGIQLLYLTPANINITLDSIPNNSLNRKIIRVPTLGGDPLMPGIYFGTSVGDSMHGVLPQALLQDEFAIASDANYLYFVWASSENPKVPGDTEIWGTRFDYRADTTSAGYYLGSGYRPNIGCVKRQNRTGPYVPQFDLAYIKTDSVSGWPRLVSVTYTNGVLDTNNLVPKFYTPTGGSGTGFANVTHVRALVSDVVGQTNPMHAVYAIVQTGAPAPAGHKHLVEYLFQTPDPSPDTAYYVDGGLISHSSPVPMLGSGQIAQVYDQPITAFANPYDAQNFLTGTPYDQFHCLYQLDIITTPNPPPPPPMHRYPLLIARGHDNGYLSTTDTRLVLNQDSSGNLLQDPDSNRYVAAINQMGIHVHWFATDTGVTTHYYSRDTGRTFDEEIDENTLVTDRCTVSDGRSHGGMLGAQLDNGLQMTIYTDPNYGASDSAPVPGSKAYGLYQPWDSTTLNPYVGTLNFEGDSVQLTIGDSEGTTAWPATLTVMPFFYCNFLGSNQGIGVHGVFDYYGLNATHNHDLSKRFIMTPFTDGTADLLGAGTIYIGSWVYEPALLDTGFAIDPTVLPGTLNVHGGADLFIGPKGKLVTDKGNIICKYEPNLYPINVATGDTNANITGHITMLGQAEFRSGDLVGSIPADTSVHGGPSAVIMSVDTGFRSFFSGGDPFQVHAVDCSFANSNPLATSIIQFGHYLDSTSSFWNIKLDSSSFSAINIHMIDPDTFCNFTISNSLFSEMHRRSIFCERDFTSDAEPFYDSITIANNNFTSIASDFVADSANGTYGIYLRNFNVTRSGDLPKTITVSGNHFTDTGNWGRLYVIHYVIGTGWDAGEQFTNSAAIAFENTTGNIIADTIEDPIYYNGIELFGLLEPLKIVVAHTRTFLCSDYLAHLHPPNWFLTMDSGDVTFNSAAALNVSYYDGYVKLTTITDCPKPFVAFGDGNPKLYFDTLDSRSLSDSLYNEQSFAAISVIANTSNIVDLSGIHGGGNDGAGYNNIRGYRSGPLLEMTSPGSLINLGNSLDTGGIPFSNYGENNILLDSVRLDSNKSYLIGAVRSSTYPTLSIALGNIDHQFWGTGVNPAIGTGTCAVNCMWNAIDTAELTAENITYDIPDSTRDSLISPPYELTCGESRAEAHKKGEEPQSLEKPDTTSRCQILFNKVLIYDQNDDFQMEYDTAKYLTENFPCCSWTPGAFTYMSDAVSHLAGNNNDCNLYNQYMQWLESVLYLCPSEEYFCACIQEMGITYCPDNDGPLGDSSSDTKLAILKWIIQNDTTCAIQGQLQQQYNTLLYELIQMWQEDSTQGIHYPLDTTLPTLASLGLDTLFAKHFLYAGVASPTISSAILSNVSASPNPVTSGTVIYFTMGKEAYVKINLYDVLGHEVSFSGFESLFQPGNYDIPISLEHLPSGTYFARLTTAYGEAAMVKLVKE